MLLILIILILIFTIDTSIQFNMSKYRVSFRLLKMNGEIQYQFSHSYLKAPENRVSRYTNIVQRPFRMWFRKVRPHLKWRWLPFYINSSKRQDYAWYLWDKYKSTGNASEKIDEYMHRGIWR